MSEESEDQLNNDVTGIQQGSDDEGHPKTLRGVRMPFRVVFIRVRVSAGLHCVTLNQTLLTPMLNRLEKWCYFPSFDF